MNPALRQKYLLWLYQNPGEQDCAEIAASLGIQATQSTLIARYLIAERLAEGNTWNTIDNAWYGFVQIAPLGMKVIENNLPHNEVQRPVTNNTVIHGDNSGIIANLTTIGNSSASVIIHNTKDSTVLFNELRDEIATSVLDEADRSILIEKIDELKNAFIAKDKPSFLNRYQEFVGLASSHIDLFSKIATNAIPALYALQAAIS